MQKALPLISASVGRISFLQESILLLAVSRESRREVWLGCISLVGKKAFLYFKYYVKCVRDLNELSNEKLKVLAE